MRKTMINGSKIPAESPTTTLTTKSSTFTPSGLVKSKTNNHSRRGVGSWQALLVWTTETLHGFLTPSTGDLMISKTGLKPYHMNRLQEAQQQLIAEAPGLTRGGRCILHLSGSPKWKFRVNQLPLRKRNPAVAVPMLADKRWGITAKPIRKLWARGGPSMVSSPESKTTNERRFFCSGFPFNTRQHNGG